MNFVQITWCYLTMYSTVKLNQQTYLDRHNIITVNNLK